MPNEVGVRVIQQTIQDVIQPAPAELPTLVVGPLYEVFVNEPSDQGFDPLKVGTTSFSWPSKRIGTVVDLNATRNGLIDSQRKPYAPMVPSVRLLDGPAAYPVADEHISQLSQSGFEISDGAKSGLERGSFSFYPISVNNKTVLYNPEGGLSAVRPGDRLSIGALSATIERRTDNSITTVEDVSSEALVPSRLDGDSGSYDVSITTSIVAGRVIVKLVGSDLTSEVPSAAVGQPVVTGVAMNGLTSLRGQVAATTTVVDGLSFGVGVTSEEVEDFIVRIVNYDTDGTYTTVDSVSFAEVVSVDPVAGEVEISASAGSNDQYVEVTIMRAQLGYIESISAPTSDEIVVVVPDTFSDAIAFADIYTTSVTTPIYPNFGVDVSYRALRKDLANVGYTARDTMSLNEVTGHSRVDGRGRDGLAKVVDVVCAAQPNIRDVYFVAVDIEPDGTTGLPENADLAGGYAEALETIEALPAHGIVHMDQIPAVNALVESHITTMSTEIENAWRQGAFIQEVPLGATQSTTGLVAPGFVPGGVASLLNSGNAIIRDNNVDFVTGAEVVAGTKVVITSPPELAGVHTALGSTTDNDLILELEGGVGAFELIREFAVPGPLDLNTISTDTHVLSGSVPSGTWVHVQPGDYVEVTENAIVYRLKVLAVNLAGTQLTCTDDVPGSLSFGTGNTNNATDASVIRTWGPNNLPAVSYHIRPLTRAQQVDVLVNGQTRRNRRFSVFLNQSPTMEVEPGVDEVLDPVISVAAVFAKRSGLRSFDETSNLVLGAGIKSCKYANDAFRKSYRKRLSDAGFTLISQKDPTSAPYIADRITSDTSSLVTQEEIVTANADWMSMSLRDSYQPPPGQQLPILTKRLIGLRAIQIDAILKAWIDEGRLIDGALVQIQRNALNKRQVDIVLLWVMPVAEKEIEFTVQLTV